MTPRLLDRAHSWPPRRWHCRALRGLRCREGAWQPAARHSPNPNPIAPIQSGNEYFNKHLAIKLFLLFSGSPQHYFKAFLLINPGICIAIWRVMLLRVISRG
jgi:hypothetical protein